MAAATDADRHTCPILGCVLDVDCRALVRSMNCGCLQLHASQCADRTCAASTATVLMAPIKSPKPESIPLNLTTLPLRIDTTPCGPPFVATIDAPTTSQNGTSSVRNALTTALSFSIVTEYRNTYRALVPTKQAAEKHKKYVTRATDFSDIALRNGSTNKTQQNETSKIPNLRGKTCLLRGFVRCDALLMS